MPTIQTKVYDTADGANNGWLPLTLAYSHLERLHNAGIMNQVDGPCEGVECASDRVILPALRGVIARDRRTC